MENSEVKTEPAGEQAFVKLSDADMEQVSGGAAHWERILEVEKYRPQGTAVVYFPKELR